MNTPKIEAWHRRQALTLASQLPDNPDDDLAVIECVRELIETFLHVDMPEPEKAAVVTLVRPRPDLSA
jgi:hypothetical protein